MEILIIAIVGACLGSFITAASYRLPRGEDIVFAKSKCPSCNNVLGARDLFPILSWIISGAKCRKCKAKISSRYVITEVVMMLITLGLFAKFGLTIQFGIFLTLATFLMVTIVADFETYIMPDSMTFGAFIMGLVNLYYFEQNWADGAMGFAVGLFVALGMHYGYKWIMKKDGLGMGDVKFLPVAGLWMGLTLLPYYFIFAGLLGILTAIFWRIAYKNPVFPFGPALAAGMFVICVFKDTVANIILSVV